ncbi:phenylacrylic acid decarboxylase [Castilleja foliolosa]|uniref:Phenylacrylic acid decarboxylase n=1 Tax=Castilleja foliolosa TaxID=1961234 RepID=A0ABD3D1Q3_9LAMI
MARYDRAITVFSPDGHLFQVEYALEAVRKGNAAVGVRGTDIIVLAVEKKSAPKLQDSRSVRKIDPVTVEYITRYIAGLQHKYTQSGGVRPFGLSTLIIGFDPHTGTPSLYQTDPSGTFSAWKANATGRNSNSIREFLEKNYKETHGQETVKLAIRALLEVVESGGKNIEVAVMTKEHGLRQLEEAQIDAIAAEIEAEKAAAEAARKGPSTSDTLFYCVMSNAWHDYLMTYHTDFWSLIASGLSELAISGLAKSMNWPYPVQFAPEPEPLPVFPSSASFWRLRQCARLRRREQRCAQRLLGRGGDWWNPIAGRWDRWEYLQLGMPFPAAAGNIGRAWVVFRQSDYSISAAPAMREVEEA